MDMQLGSTKALIDECRRQGLLRNQCAYVLATAFWETARTMTPVVEAFWKSEAWRKKNLRYYPWHGRGFVQLTWEKNYIRAAKATGQPLDKKPELALQPDIAVTIIVTGMREGWFTKKKLSDYITLAKSDYPSARRIINGVDKKDEIAKIAREYDMDLKVQGYGEGKPGSVAASIPVPKPPPVPDASPAPAQVTEKPNVVLMDGPKADETTVVVVKTPQNVPQTSPIPTSKTGYAVFGAMLIAIGTAAAKYWGG